MAAFLEVQHPQGASEVSVLHAPRLDDLDGKTVALLSDDMWQSHRMLPLVRERLKSRYPNIRFINETELPLGSAAIDRDSTVETILARGADAVVVGNAS
jgi:hypothetical protein